MNEYRTKKLVVDNQQKHLTSLSICQKKKRPFVLHVFYAKWQISELISQTCSFGKRLKTLVSADDSRCNPAERVKVATKVKICTRTTGFKAAGQLNNSNEALKN